MFNTHKYFLKKKKKSPEEERQYNFILYVICFFSFRGTLNTSTGNKKSIEFRREEKFHRSKSRRTHRGVKSENINKYNFYALLN